MTLALHVPPTALRGHLRIIHGQYVDDVKGAAGLRACHDYDSAHPTHLTIPHVHI